MPEYPYVDEYPYFHDISEVSNYIVPEHEALQAFNLAMENLTYDPVTDWRQKDLRVVKIAGMSDDHLVNTARMLNRNGWYYSSITQELNRRGLHA